MFELTDSVGKKIFESFSITLVCEDCLKTEHPEKCTHKLAEMPRWLSSSKMETVKVFSPDQSRNFCTPTRACCPFLQALLSEDPAML